MTTIDSIAAQVGASADPDAVAVQRRLTWAHHDPPDLDALLTYEWLVTNGLGGSASGTIAGVVTRRFHGLLVAALPAPLGRTVMVSHLSEQLRLPDGRVVPFGGDEPGEGLPDVPAARYVRELRLDLGLPIWTFEIEGYRIEKRIILPHRQNTVYVSYALLDGPSAVRLELRPSLHFRPHEARVDGPLDAPYLVTALGKRYEIHGPPPLPPLRLLMRGPGAMLALDGGQAREIRYRLEESRGYDARGLLWSPGAFSADLAPGDAGGAAGQPATLTASTESWEAVEALDPAEAARAEGARRRGLLQAAPAVARHGTAAELVLAADQFIIRPVGRAEDLARAHAAGDDVSTVIAGYHWFTDWGRDTMISLEGLTLTTGRVAEAGAILRMFGRHVRDGLIPNMFPEGQNEGLYHTADATLWFFHALDRYLAVSGDRRTVRDLLPILSDIVAHHLRGTRFGIGVDPADGLLRQGADGYQLTWMDAKVGDWVVTPRRGKAVEINALWYNALRLLAGWLAEEGHVDAAADLTRHADLARASFNERFWYPDGGYLYDVLDGEDGRDDAACRPNQVLAIALPHPILARERWASVLQVVRDRLLTPVGLRSLAPGHPDYKAHYFGDLRSRDAAYHQGTVWGWLAGPFVDAWLAAYPEDRAGARQVLVGFEEQLGQACLGTLSEIFDAEPPHTPRGCVAQAWSVAEVLRALVKTSGRPADA